MNVDCELLEGRGQPLLGRVASAVHPSASNCPARKLGQSPAGDRAWVRGFGSFRVKKRWASGEPTAQNELQCKDLRGYRAGLAGVTWVMMGKTRRPWQVSSLLSSLSSPTSFHTRAGPAPGVCGACRPMGAVLVSFSCGGARTARTSRTEPVPQPAVTPHPTPCSCLSGHRPPTLGLSQL